MLVYGDLPPVRLALRPWYADPGLRARAGITEAVGRSRHRGRHPLRRVLNR